MRPTTLQRIALENQDRVPMYVGTGAYTDEALRIIDLCGLTSLVGHVVGADRVDNPKPAPDTFLLCAQLMGIAPERCVVFEDSQLGLKPLNEPACTVSTSYRSTTLSMTTSFKRARWPL